MERIFAEVRKMGVPMIMHGVGAAHLVNEWHDLPLDVVGLDWRLPIEEARARAFIRRYKVIWTLHSYLHHGLLLKNM